MNPHVSDFRLPFFAPFLSMSGSIPKETTIQTGQSTLGLGHHHYSYVEPAFAPTIIPFLNERAQDSASFIDIGEKGVHVQAD
jgi:hypothetical protein